MKRDDKLSDLFCGEDGEMQGPGLTDRAVNYLNKAV